MPLNSILTEQQNNSKTGSSNKYQTIQSKMYKYKCNFWKCRKTRNPFFCFGHHYRPSVSPQIQHNYLYVFPDHMGTWLQKKSTHYSQK